MTIKALVESWEYMHEDCCISIRPGDWVQIINISFRSYLSLNPIKVAEIGDMVRVRTINERVRTINDEGIYEGYYVPHKGTINYQEVKDGLYYKNVPMQTILIRDVIKINDPGKEL